MDDQPPDGTMQGQGTAIAQANPTSRARRLKVAGSLQAHQLDESDRKAALPAGAITDETTVFKKNDLVNARYKLSLGAHRLLAMYLGLLPRKFDVPPLLKIPIIQVAETWPAYRKGGTRFADIMIGLNDLYEASIDVKNGDSGDFARTRWAPTCLRVGNYVFIRLGYDLMPYIKQLKKEGRYTEYNFRYLLELKTPYQFRFYELFVSYAYTHQVRLYFEELKKWLEIPEDEYQNVAHFKDRVIVPVLVAINQLTDLHVEIKEPIKDGRKIIGWHFSIEYKPQEMLPPSPSVSALVERLALYNFSPTEANHLATYYTEDYLLEKMDFVDNEIQNDRVENPAAFLRTALEQDWKPRPSPEEAKQERKRVLTSQAAEKAALEETAKRVEKAKGEAAWALRVEHAYTKLKDLDAEGQAEVQRLFQQFILDNPNTTLAPRFQRNGLEDMFIQPLYRTFIVNHFAIPEPDSAAVQQRVADNMKFRSDLPANSVLPAYIQPPILGPR